MPTFPTLTTNPSYPLSPDGDLENAVLRSNFESGYEQTRPKFTRARRSYGLSYELKEADLATLRDFELTTLRNGADSFVWTHPLRGTSNTVRLTEPIKFNHANYGLTEARLNLREV